jgi:hypothetical protein
MESQFGNLELAMGKDRLIRSNWEKRCVFGELLPCHLYCSILLRYHANCCIITALPLHIPIAQTTTATTRVTMRTTGTTRDRATPRKSNNRNDTHNNLER